MGIVRCEQRVPEQLGCLVTAVLRVDVELEQVVKFGRGVGNDLRQFLPRLGEPPLVLLPLGDLQARGRR